MAGNAYQDALRQFAANSLRDQALGRPTQMSSTGLAQKYPALPNAPVTKPQPIASKTPAPSQPQPVTTPNVGWGSNAGQPRPGNTPYPQQPWQPAYGNPQQYQQGMGQQPPQQAWNYPPQVRPQQARQQTPYQYQQQGAQPWQTGNQYAPNVSGMPGWANQVQRPNYQQQFNPYSLPTQQMVRPMSPGQSHDSFMGAYQNPLAGQIANKPTWRQSPAMPVIPQIPAMPAYQGAPNPWAQPQQWQRPQQSQQPQGTQGGPIRVTQPPLQYDPNRFAPYSWQGW